MAKVMMTFEEKLQKIDIDLLRIKIEVQINTIKLLKRDLEIMNNIYDKRLKNEKIN